MRIPQFSTTPSKRSTADHRLSKRPARAPEFAARAGVVLDLSLDGTYVSVDPDHLSRYVTEQATRFNQRGTNDAGRFVTVTGGVDGKRLNYADLTERPEGTPPRRGG